MSAARAVAEHLHRRLVDLTAEIPRLGPRADYAAVDALSRDVEAAVQLARRLEDVLRAVEGSVAS